MSYSTVAAKSVTIGEFMTDPVTDLQTLSSRPNDMKTIMELMIMNIQVSQANCYLCMKLFLLMFKIFFSNYFYRQNFAELLKRKNQKKNSK